MEQYLKHLDLDYRDESCIGSIKFIENINENEIGSKNRFKTNHIGECKIYVYSKEGSMPHFHIFNYDHSFESCICIYSNNYFSHGGVYTSKLSNNQCKELNKWLMKTNITAFNVLTNWQLICTIWENNNPDCKFPESNKIKIQPHYENMINYKDI